MELTKEQQKEQKRLLLNLLKRMILLFEQNNIRWWMAFGSCIGAVRHHGFIPWDDDIDIFIPYEDYSRLLTMKKELEGIDMALDIPFTANNCCTYAKLYDVKSTVWQVESLESIIGLWIDIFPLYQTNMTIDEYKECKKKYTGYNNDYLGGVQKPLLKDFRQLIRGFHFRSLWIWLYNMTYRKMIFNRTIEKFNVFIDSLNDPKGKFYMFPYSYSDVTNYFPIEWFEETIKMPFEDTKVNVMSGYDNMLTQQYGDYMTPPHADQQITHHSFYFINLEQKLTKEDIQKSVKISEPLI